VSRTIRPTAPGSPRGFDLGLNLIFRHRWSAGCFERRSDCQEPIQGGQAPCLAGEEIHEILYLAEPFGRQGLNLLKGAWAFDMYGLLSDRG
jgi:hypothetical protein